MKIDDLSKVSDGPRTPTPASVTHIAGPVLSRGGRYIRQRCSWCGAVLIDVDITRDRVETTWTVEAFVRCQEGAPPTFVKGEPVSTDLLEHGAPHDCCMFRDPA